jgi:hypothetical protein
MLGSFHGLEFQKPFRLLWIQLHHTEDSIGARLADEVGQTF